VGWADVAGSSEMYHCNAIQALSSAIIQNWLLRVDRGKLFLFMNCDFLVELSILIGR
jgi:hypothetical protein